MNEHFDECWDDLDAIQVEVTSFRDEEGTRLYAVMLTVDERQVERLEPRPSDPDDEYASLFFSSDKAEAFAAEQRVLLRALIHEHAADLEQSCPLSVRECENCTAAALDAGIPLSVIQGKTTIRQHFSEAEIARNAGDKERAEAIERLDLIDAGRGHLVRR